MLSKRKTIKLFSIFARATVFIVSIVLILIQFGCHYKLKYKDFTHWACENKQSQKGCYCTYTVMVRFAQGTTAAQRQEVAASVNGHFLDNDNNGKDDNYESITEGCLAVILLHGDRETDMAKSALQKLRSNPDVQYAELDYMHFGMIAPNDLMYRELWPLNNIGQAGGTPGADIKAESAWDITTGSDSVVVGLVDTGVNYYHEDLIGNIWTNPGEIPGNGKDDDMNGYIDDVHGMNAILNTGDPMDDNGHGSHCAGIIGAVGNNGRGVTGVNWKVKLIGMKFLDSTKNGKTSDAIKCIAYAVALKRQNVNIRLLNCSWGCPQCFSQPLMDAIESASSEGILLVTAAGNLSSNDDSIPFYPASFHSTNVLTVAATDYNDILSPISNYGFSTVDIGAPGVSILSTTLGNSYSELNGTSMATAYVTGAAALLLSINNSLPVAELKSILMESGDADFSLQGKTVSGRRLNLKNAINLALRPH